MITYAFFNQKGGVGKTTFAVHFAEYMARTGRSVYLLDFDRQRHASKWIEESQVQVQSGYMSPMELARRIRTAHKAGGSRLIIKDQARFDTLVLDAPGELDVAKPALLIADIVVMPCVPSPDDVHSTIESLVAIQRVRKARSGRPFPIVFLNRADKRSVLWGESKAALEALRTRGVPTCEAFMPSRAAIPRARKSSSVVRRLPFARSAAAEMDQLFEEIETYGRTKQDDGSEGQRAVG